MVKLSYDDVSKESMVWLLRNTGLGEGAIYNIRK